MKNFYFFIFLSTSSGEAHASRDHFFHFILSLDFNELWCRVMSICLFTDKLSGNGLC